MNGKEPAHDNSAASALDDVMIDEVKRALRPIRDGLQEVHTHVSADASKLNKVVSSKNVQSKYRDDINRAKYEQGPNGAWTGDEVNDVLVYAGLSLSGASFVISSLGRMLYVPISSRAVESLARTVIETCAKAWWILDPDISVHTRVQRALSDELSSAHQMLFAMRKTHNSTLTTYAKQRLATTVNFAQSLGLVLKSNKRGELSLQDITRPSMSSLVETFLRSLGFITGAPVMYGWLSSATHGDTLHHVQIAGEVPDPPIVTLADIVPILRIVVVAFRALHLRYAEYVGSSSAARVRPYNRLIALFDANQENDLPVGRY